MLRISPQVASALGGMARPGFADQLREELADKYPHFLPRFPPAIQARIVSNMLQRATTWGLDLQSSLTAYCEYMIAVVANFDEEPEIRAVLERERPRLNLLIPDLPDFVSDAAWDNAEVRGSSLPFFVPPALAAESLMRRTAEAIKLALGDRPEAHAAEASAAAALHKAHELGLTGEDASLVIAAGTSLCGSDETWLANLLRDGLQDRVLVEAIRFRLALDFGRFI